MALSASQLEEVLKAKFSKATRSTSTESSSKAYFSEGAASPGTNKSAAAIITAVFRSMNVPVARTIFVRDLWWVTLSSPRPLLISSGNTGAAASFNPCASR